MLRQLAYFTISKSSVDKTVDNLETSFSSLASALMNDLKTREKLNIELKAEKSLFVRFNDSRVRQSTETVEGRISLTLMSEHKTLTAELPWSFDFNISLKQCEQVKESCRAELMSLRSQVAKLPQDPYQVLPEGSSTSKEIVDDLAASESEIGQNLLSAFSDHPSCLTGLLTVGPVIRAFAHSQGASHWFSVNQFILNYTMGSLGAPERSVKGFYSATRWDSSELKKNLLASERHFQLMNRNGVKLAKGNYRVYLAPAAVYEILQLLAWDAFSERAYRQGASGLSRLRENKENFSPLLTLVENFGLGLSNRFNEWGELSPSKIALIEDGELKSNLICSRSAKEFEIPGNQANLRESIQSTEILPGQLPSADEQVLDHLGEGIYISNLHYLNWSERRSGRITGMTRYACFWVQRGKIVGPIENLRFDESIFNFWGQALEGLTTTRELQVSPLSYEMRDLGGALVPGMLIKSFSFTL